MSCSNLWAAHGRLVGFCGLIQMTAGLAVICDFCGSQQMQNWQQICCSIDLMVPCLSEALLHPIYKLPVASLLPGSQPQRVLFLGLRI